MATYTYDDGSTITNDATPTGWTTSATPATDSGLGAWTQTQAEEAKFRQFYPQSTNSWEGMATYGLTRAVDAAYVRLTQPSNTQPATYAGQNGQTYTSGQRTRGAAGGESGLLLIGLGALAFMALA